VEGWSRDANEDVARELERHLAAETGEIPPALQDFIELQLGPRRRPAKLAAEGVLPCLAKGTARPSATPRARAFIRCLTCEEMLNIRWGGEAIAHLHGQEIEEEPRRH
jgi:hypothetical protein